MSERPPALSLSIPSWDMATAAAVAAAAVVGTSAGDGFVAVALLLVAAGPWTGATAAVAMAATVARWGTADLAAVAGDQAVLGAAVTVGPPAALASSALAALALLLVARCRQPGWIGWVAPVALGLGAAALVAGPSPVGLPEVAVRTGSAVAGIAVALLVARFVDRRRHLDRPLTTAAPAAALASLALAVVA